MTKSRFNDENALSGCAGDDRPGTELCATVTGDERDGKITIGIELALKLSGTAFLGGARSRDAGRAT